MTARILVVDDEPDIRWTLGQLLDLEGFDVMSAGSARDALDRISKAGLPHLALVDIMMPEMDGIELCRRLHEFSDVPILMLTAVDDKRTVTETILEFAEDYVVKPFDPEELVARIRRVLSRFESSEQVTGPLIRIEGRVTLDLATGRARVDEEDVELTPTETRILHILIRNAGRTVSTRHLLQRVWPREEVFEDALRVHIHRIRRKIEVEPSRPSHLLTERGLGYRFERRSQRP